MLRALIILLVPLFIYAQSSNWNSVVDLNRSVNSDDRIDLYSDADGNHILIENGSTLKYYLYNYAGSYVRTYTIDNSISATYSKLTGWDGTLYVSYKEGSTIYTKKSANAGQSWSALDNITLGDSDSDGLELWTDGDGLHIVYSVWDDNNDVYETFYRLSEHGENDWINYKTVTDESGMVGGRPSVTTSSSRVHVAFNNEYDDAYTRDKYNTTWQSSQTVATWYTLRNMVIATSEKLHSVYSELHVPLVYLMYRNRSLSGSTWSTAMQIVDQTGSSENSKPDMAVSTNDKMHLVYYYSGDLEYREWDGSMSNAYDVMELIEAPRISANSNDIFVIGITDDGASGYELKMRQRDYAPLAPTGLSLSSNHNDNPVLTWDANQEADLKEYRIYRKWEYGSYQHVGTTTAISWTDEIILLPQGDLYSYYVKAKDQFNNYSSPSDTVSCYAIWKKANPDIISQKHNLPLEYALNSCYPNPFNSTTIISFDLPKAGNVLLQVYNSTGQLIATPAHAFFEAGRYTLNFDASRLSSGIYLYKITASEFSAVKRMLLVK